MANQNENEKPTTTESQESKEKPVLEESVKGDGDVPASAESNDKKIPTRETNAEASVASESDATSKGIPTRETNAETAAASDATSTDTSNTCTSLNSKEKASYHLRRKSTQPVMCPIVEENEKEADETTENVEIKVAAEHKVEEIDKDLTETEKSSQNGKEAIKKSDEDNFKVVIFVKIIAQLVHLLHFRFRILQTSLLRG